MFFLIIKHQQGYKKCKGIALIQVLLITAILSVLALYLTNTAREQIKIAQWFSDKSLALVALHSAETQIMFDLLTKPKEELIQNSFNTQSIIEKNVDSQWYFFGKPFQVSSQVKVSIQDHAGLIHAQFPEREYLEKLLFAEGLTDSEVNETIDNLLDWQDLDSIPRINGSEASTYSGFIRNGAIPDVHDLLFINKFRPELLKVLLETVSIYRQGSFNPTNSPDKLLYALTTASVAEQIIKKRESGQLTKKVFSQLTGIVENENTFFYPSNILTIKFISEVGEAKVSKVIIIHLNPYAKAEKTPINLLSNSD